MHAMVCIWRSEASLQCLFSFSSLFEEGLCYSLSYVSAGLWASGDSLVSTVQSCYRCGLQHLAFWNRFWRSEPRSPLFHRRLFTQWTVFSGQPWLCSFSCLVVYNTLSTHSSHFPGFLHLFVLLCFLDGLPYKRKEFVFCEQFKTFDGAFNCAILWLNKLKYWNLSPSGIVK